MELEQNIPDGWPVIGHDQVVRLLQRELASGRISHAYLFTGPPQVGKTTLALVLAQALVCQGDAPPCGQCLSCHKVQQGTHPDVRVVTGDDAGTIKIDQIRALQRELSLSPYEAGRRVAVIVAMEGATEEASNCFLKTLEEPPGSAVLLLTAPEPDVLLPTIVSRCRQVSLRPVPAAQIEAALRTRWGVDAEQARLLARLSAGRPGWAVTALQDPTVLARRRQRLDKLLEMLEAGRLERLAYAEQLSRDTAALPEVLDLWLGWWRDVLLVHEGCEEAVVNQDFEKLLRREATRYDRKAILTTIKDIRETRKRLEERVNTRLALEVLLLHLPAVKQRPMSSSS